MQCSNINKSLCHTWRLKRHSDVWVVSVKASCQLAWAAGKTHYVGRWNAACTLGYVAVAPGRPTSTCLFKIYFFYKILLRVCVVILNNKNLYFLFFNKTLLRQSRGVAQESLRGKVLFSSMHMQCCLLCLFECSFYKNGCTMKISDLMVDSLPCSNAGHKSRSYMAPGPGSPGPSLSKGGVWKSKTSF